MTTGRSPLAESLLWNALTALEDRLSKAEAQFPALQQDHGRLLLRQMASQTENKLARRVKPGLTPKDAVHMTFSRLSKGSDKGVDKAAFQRVVQQYPGLADGLKSLKELGTSVTHPVTARTSAGGQQAVTSELLRELIAKEYTDDDPVKQDLALHLGESIFVPTI
ncbi:hypothetical protein GPECTOR_33g546 [Gonium pectorale]|uniref:Uncharacterized protein n=1 Tax=Gonium pectorale TaxID=33097 RepID=A0A150GCU4_GONPE|nr:hypothetical protein GPECTOR_33g546 [Gonium pectorale]|eukprot:KXZ47664.1 hypothetical protein GPECTOR_33g546 [Gonium pectorale]